MSEWKTRDQLSPEQRAKVDLLAHTPKVPFGQLFHMIGHLGSIKAMFVPDVDGLPMLCVDDGFGMLGMGQLSQIGSDMLQSVINK